jgi:hypothetical protein
LWSKLLGQESKPARSDRRVEDPRLGRIEFDDGEGSWSAIPMIDGRAIRFLIGGDDLPDQGLVQHAVAILDDIEAFRRRIRGFLQVEAAAKPRFANEIKQLEISHVCLWWPNRRDDGMIYFTGPDRFRVWRCDYIDGTPTSLGFDS